jgi:hypothetical protein
VPAVVYVAHVTILAVILLDAALHAPDPTVFVAFTLNVYEVPFVKPVTVTGELAPEPVKPPGVDVAVYVNVDGMPGFAGAVKVTDAQFEVPAVAVPIVGAPGGVGHSP